MKTSAVLDQSRAFIQQRLFLFGLLFWGVNSTAYYVLYQVNSYKILLVLASVTLLTIFVVWSYYQSGNRAAPWSLWGFLGLPLLVTLPGYWFYQGKYNYNFDYELVTNLSLILWVVFLYQITRRTEDLRVLFLFMGITLLYSSIWAWVELFDVESFSLNLGQGSSMKATFGNRNYFSGFLIQLLPLFLILSIPESNSSKKDELKSRWSFSKWNRFALLTFIITLCTIVTAQSRAALGATLVSLFITILGYAFFLSSSKTRKRIILALGVSLALLIIAFFLFYSLDEGFQQSRLAAVFNIEAWYGRFMPWEAAVTSIQGSPWIGYGLGSSYNLFFQFVPANARLFHSEHSYNHVHSEYLEYLQEAGLVGGIVFLFFWGYLFLQIFRIVRNSSSPLAQKVAIGIAGGFIAYLIQSLFSVAPRMMVVKFPLYTLIAVVLILARFTVASSPVIKSSKSLTNTLKHFIPISICLVLAWSLYVPWMKGQYEFVEIRQTPPSSLHVDQLEALVQQRKDVYALNYLSHLNLGYRQPQKLRETIKLIDQTLPDYRDLGFVKAQLAYMEKDFPAATQAALKYQEGDRYFIPVIEFLLKLSAQQGDRKLFFEQVQLITRKLAFDQQLPILKKEEAVRVDQGRVKSALKVIFTPSDLYFQWNEQFIQYFFQSVLKSQRLGKWRRKEKALFVRSLGKSMETSPYFFVQIRKGFEQEQQQIMTLMDRRILLVRERDQFLRRLDQKHRVLLVRSRRSERAKIQKAQALERGEKGKPYQNRLEQLEKTLRLKTEFDQYLKRQQFKQAVIRNFSQVAFPTSG
ncbi:MAG: hypothetical protein COB67_11425 [SAR324 cluster bacterium]|uniref:O-antigen ligase-related domain-containing protein n=1 Tax=SAR324 cluster bacterium TaxID=2024889 RepID=A0A2A4SUB4_9DELT|nr:MAG: hypothetical protein COB67_11425 [SAR324 cluster bacterium]